MINSVNSYNVNKGYEAKAVAEVSSQTCSKPSFGMNFPFFQSDSAGVKPNITLRTKLNKHELNQYNNLINSIDKTSRKRVEVLLKKGILLNSNSQDKSTVLDNLNKIAEMPRAKGLDSVNLIQSTIEILDDPFKSTQKFGDIPENYKSEVISTQINDSGNKMSVIEAEKAVNVNSSGTCPAASIQFSLAQKAPAEFARFVEGVSSPEMAVEKEISLENLADTTLDAVWLLNAFEIPYTMNDFCKANLKFAPDKNALLRARMQTTNQDNQERSAVDVLLQSTFMNVGSQQTYNSLTDTRAGKFNEKDTGLVEFEKTFTESIVDDKNKITLINQIIDENERLVGYESDLSKLKQQILDTLAQDENIIIGYTFVDRNNNLLGGHEITIVGSRKDSAGRTYLICNDSDDKYFGAIEYLADDLLPKIHHATFPKNVVEKDLDFQPNWIEGLKSYKEMKK
ncbi:MAG: hypothetical protein R3Y28_01595 [Candidatus Gastranaerophilales bacterium]